MKMKATLLILLFAVLLPLIVSFAWFHTNHGYPKDDAAEFAVKAVESYTAFKTQGIEAGLRFAYSTRAWKPLLYPFLVVPFLELAGGDVNTGVFLAGYFFLLIFLIYAFLLIAEFVPLNAAALALLVFGMLPWVVGNSYRSAPYLPFSAFAIAAIYYFVKSNLFRKTRFTVGFGTCLGLAACMRPVETANLFALPLILFTVRAFREKVIRVRDVLLAFFLGCAFAACFAIRVDPDVAGQHLFLGLFLVILGLCLMPQFARRFGFSQGYAMAAILCAVFCIGWFAPRLPDLLDWARAGSIDVGQDTHHRLGLPGFLLRYLQVFGEIPLLCLLLIAALGGPVVRFIKGSELLSWAWIVWGPIVLCCVIGKNGCLVYYLPGATLLTLPFLIWAVDPARKLPALRHVLLLALVLVLFFVNLALIFPNSSRLDFRGAFTHWDDDLVLGHRPDPEPEAARLIMNQLRDRIGADPAKLALLFDWRDTGEATDGAKLELARGEKLLPWSLYTMPFDSGGGAIECVKKIRETSHRCGYFLVGPVGSRDTNSINDLQECTAWLVGQWRAKQLRPLNLKYVSDVFVPRSTGERHYLLLHVEDH